MDGFADWVFRGVASALVVAFAALFGRMRKLETEAALLNERFSGIESHGTKAASDLAAEVHKLQLCLERNFVRREQWVPAISRIEGLLEEQGRLVARIDERQRANER